MDTIAGHLSFTNNVTFSKNEDEYYINWSSNMIIPSLNDTDKLRVKTIEANRGNIYKRNDTILAGPGKISSVGFVPGKMSENKEEDIRKVAELLETTEDKINQALNATYVKEDTFVKIRKYSNR